VITQTAGIVLGGIKQGEADGVVPEHALGVADRLSRGSIRWRIGLLVQEPCRGLRVADLDAATVSTRRRSGRAEHAAVSWSLCPAGRRMQRLGGVVRLRTRRLPPIPISMKRTLRFTAASGRPETRF
jgi:hypothetical protein